MLNWNKALNVSNPPVDLTSSHQNLLAIMTSVDFNDNNPIARTAEEWLTVVKNVSSQSNQDLELKQLEKLLMELASYNRVTKIEQGNQKLYKLADNNLWSHS